MGERWRKKERESGSSTVTKKNRLRGEEFLILC